jgi:hypothetical protein
VDIWTGYRTHFSGISLPCPDILDDGDEQRCMDEQNESPEVNLPENEDDLIAELEDKRGRELTEEEANLAVAQGKLIGDL